MRKLSSTLFLTLFLACASHSQVINVEDDFEGTGTITSWFGDDCEIDNATTNPYSIVPNTSSKVLRYTDSGGQYANVRFDLPANFDLSMNAVFSFSVYVPSSGITGAQPNQISLKLQDGTDASPWLLQTEVIKPILLDQWQTVSFDFINDTFINFDAGSPNPAARTDLNRVLIQINGENNNDLVEAFIDDFTYNGTIGSGPAPAPSIFSQLVWSDEFDTDGEIDSTKWFHQTQLPNGWGWYNGEEQHYTNRTDNSYVENGLLHIVAKKESFTDQGHTKDYTSARLNSKFAFTNGRVVVRAKLPYGSGTWPAIWTLGTNIIETGGYWNASHGSVNWPACGEIDIMEHWGHNQNFVQSALHTPASSGPTVTTHSGLWASHVSDNFHVYELEWHADSIVFSLDGSPYYTYAPSPQTPSNWPFAHNHYLLLNVAMQGNIDPNFSESHMVIDYVRVYQNDEVSGISAERELDGLKVYPNPTREALHIDWEGSQSIRGTIVGVNGAEIRSIELDPGKTQVDVSHFASGIYWLNTEFDNKIYSISILVE